MSNGRWQAGGMTNQTGMDVRVKGLQPHAVKTGEEQFLESLLQFTRSAKKSQRLDVALAAKRWEGTIAFRIRLTMQSREVRAARAKNARPTASRSGGRSRPSVSQGRD